ALGAGQTMEFHIQICFHEAKIRPRADLVESFRNRRFGRGEFVEPSSQSRTLVKPVGAPGGLVAIRWGANFGDVTFDLPQIVLVIGHVGSIATYQGSAR